MSTIRFRTPAQILAVSLALLLISGSAPLLVEPVPGLAKHTQCSDGKDNDHDGRIDYPQDDDCEELEDDFEGVGLSGLFVAVTDGKDTVTPNGDLTYVITLRQERTDLRLVDLDLHLPHQANIVGVSGGGRIIDGRAHWDNVPVQPKQTTRLTVTVNVSPKAKEGLLIIARAIAEGTESTDTTLVKGPFISPQSYSIRISDGQEFVQQGEKLRYTVRVRNLNDEATVDDVRVTVSPIVNVTDTRPMATKADTSKILWKGVHFAKDEERIFNFDVTVEERVPAYVHVFMRAYVNVTSAVDDTVVQSGIPPHSVAVSIDDNREFTRVGDVLVYTVNVQNRSKHLATDVNVSASLPIYSEFVDADEGGRWDGKNVRWNLLQIAAEDTRTLTYKIRVRSDAPDDATLLASATTAGSSDSDTTMLGHGREKPRYHRPEHAERPYIAQDKHDDEGSVLFRKVADRSEVAAGGTVRYTLYVRNVLDHAVTDAVITDRFDAGVFSVVSSGNGQELGAGVLEWEVPVLQPGDVWEVSYVLRANASLPHGSTLSNIATIRGDSLKDISIHERVTVTRSGVMQQMPSTGAPMDAIFVLLSAGMAAGPAFAQRRLLRKR